MIRLVASALLLCAVSTTPILAQPDYKKPSDIPVDAFADLPSFDRPRLSPDGDKLAYFISRNGRRHIVFQNLNGSERGIIPPAEHGEIVHFFWASDSFLVIENQTNFHRREFGQEVENFSLYSFNIKKSKYVWLGEPEKKMAIKRKESGHTFVSQIERVVDRLPNDPDHILIGLDFDVDAKTEVFRVNLKSGRRKLVQKEFRGVQSWYTDFNSEIRAGFGFHESQRYAIFKKPSGELVTLANAGWTDDYDFVDFAKDSNFFYVSGQSQHGTKGLFKLNAQTGQIAEEVFSHPEYDFLDTVFHPATGKLVGVSYFAEYRQVHYLDKNFGKLQRGLSKALTGNFVSITSKAQNSNKYLILAYNDTNPGDYYLFDRDKGELNYLAPRRDKISTEMSSPTKKVDIPVRDGSTIQAFLTLPKSGDGKNLPAIVLPHGGPEARDNANWEYESQFHASRGYIVLKPNFRGSTGYGDAFLQKGKKQWGGLMQDDLTDATKWLISEGYADPERICIVGSSYGGYAALMGTIKEQNLYKCAVSINGVTNIPSLKTADKKYIGGRAWIKDIGLEGVDDKQVSPHHRADDVSAPILLISSKDDQRIPYEHTNRLHSVLKSQGKKSELINIERGGHHMRTAESRLITLRETEKFLAKHIGD